MEWTTVTVLIALVGLGAAVIKPIVSLTQTITKLTVVVENLGSDLENQRAHSRASHQRIWEHSGEQDRRIEDHERRIGTLEQKEGEEA